MRLLLTLAVVFSLIAAAWALRVTPSSAGRFSRHLHTLPVSKVGGRGALGMSASGESCDALIVGSGISGSTAAFYLHRQGIDVAVAEAKDRMGGNLITRKEDGYLWEEGPNSFQPNTAIMRLSRDLGMLPDLALADPKLPRFVFWKEKLYALPSGPADLLSFNLLSWPGRIRAGLGALGVVCAPPSHEESVKEWVVRHLGDEAFERIIDPFISGVYAGDPSKLSMKAALKKIFKLEHLGYTRSIVEGALVHFRKMSAEKSKTAKEDAGLPRPPSGSLGSFKQGLQSVTDEIQSRLGDRAKLSHKLVGVRKTDDGKKWVAVFDTPNGEKTITTKALLLTAPAYAVADVLGNDMPQLQALKSVHYPPVASVTLAYPDSAFRVPMKGFGNLLPRAMKLRTLGTIWSSSLFPGRAPAGQTMLLNYIGGAQDEGIASLSPEEIAEQVHQDVSRVLLKPDAPKPRVLGVRIWPHAIPQYERGHAGILAHVEEAQASNPGLFLGGNYRSGVSFGDCVQFGHDVAKTVSEYLDQCDADPQ